MTAAVFLTARESLVLGKIAGEGGWSFSVGDGLVTVVSADLPGRMAVSLARQGPVLWVVVDLAKRESRDEVAVIMASWARHRGNRWATRLYPAPMAHTLADVERLVTTGIYDGRCMRTNTQ